MALNTEYLKKCIQTLEKSYSLIKTTQENTIDYEIYRNSLIKSLEMTLEQTGKLLRKRITPYFATKKEVDSLTFKDLFRYAAKYSLISQDEVKRWFLYRDNRNNTAHDYGRDFAEQTLKLIDDFIKDVYNIKNVIENE
ncbi:MAG: nucleotidyltransferase substrate binding protein [Candidatus Gastranaerophilales bacterium]|nr:nucleotidyltransferase substrate binding protein [Candidatus Gastranaerophilales bacterium]